MMMYEDFKKAVTEGLENEGFEVRTSKVFKNNEERDALSVIMKGFEDKNGNIYGATFYPKDFYDGGECVEDAVSMIIEGAKESKESKIGKCLTEQSLDMSRESVLAKVVPDVMRVDSNEEFLNTLAHRKVEGTDLAIYFRYVVGKVDGGLLSTPLPLSTISKNEIAVEELELYAWKNILGNGVKLKVIGEHFFELTTSDEINGAVLMFSNKLMSVIMENEDIRSFKIVPLSINEVVLLGDNACISDEELLGGLRLVNMMNEINNDKRSILSDHLYIYENGKLSNYSS